VDPSLRDEEGHHNSALFVQSVPYTLAGGARWEDEEERYVAHLLSICDRFAPGTSALVADTFTLTPPKARPLVGGAGSRDDPPSNRSHQPRSHASRLSSPLHAPPQKQIEQHFGITGGHIHHIDNSFSFDERFPARTPLQARGERVARCAFCCCARSAHIHACRGASDIFPAAPPPIHAKGLYSASAGCHPAGSVIGCAGHNAAVALLRDLGRRPDWLAA
jgi:hypothetical protein